MSPSMRVLQLVFGSQNLCGARNIGVQLSAYQGSRRPTRSGACPARLLGVTMVALALSAVMVVTMSAPSTATSAA